MQMDLTSTEASLLAAAAAAPVVRVCPQTADALARLYVDGLLEVSERSETGFQISYRGVQVIRAR